MSQPTLAGARPGALEGVRVVELASEHGAFAGKMLADLGAEVIVVEPPGGHASRRFEPFLDDTPGLERSLWWWYYNTGKQSVVLDLHDSIDAARFRKLVASSDIVLEGEEPGLLAGLGLGYEEFGPHQPELVWVSITPFGSMSPRGHEPLTDLTLLAGAGPAWSCGYDDHLLPPVRPGGNQGYHTACLWAVEATMVAIYAASDTRLRSACRREHACRIQCHDRSGNIRVARRRRNGAAADLSSCRSQADTPEAHDSR